MEAAKLLALKDKLSSATARMKGAGAGARRSIPAAGTNPLYSRFVRAGTWNPDDDLIGRDFTGKREKFADPEAEGADDAVTTITIRNGEVDVRVHAGSSAHGGAGAAGKEKKEKKEKKDKKEKKEKKNKSEDSDDESGAAAASFSSSSGVGSKRKRAAGADEEMDAASVQMLLQSSIVDALHAAAGSSSSSSSPASHTFVERSSLGRSAVKAALAARSDALAAAGFGKDDLKGLLGRAFAALLLSGALESSDDGDSVRVASFTHAHADADADADAEEEKAEKKEKKDKKDKKEKKSKKGRDE